MSIDFSTINKSSSKSFHDQKALIKKVLNGKQVLCQQCRQPLLFIAPEESDEPGIRCQKGCTFIALEFE